MIKPKYNIDGKYLCSYFLVASCPCLCQMSYKKIWKTYASHRTESKNAKMIENEKYENVIFRFVEFICFVSSIHAERFRNGNFHNGKECFKIKNESCDCKSKTNVFRAV